MTDGARIVSLHVYPVKGCRALDRARSVVTPTGLELDRNWMFVNDAGRFLSQRECAGLALIDVDVTESELVLSAAGHPSLRCPLAASGATRRVVIWRDTCLARETGVDTREWLARVTGTRGQLVQGIHGEARISDPVFTGTDRGEAFFPDAYALLVISTASLAALNARLPSPLPMNRFRPNIVVSGLPPFGEDLAHEFKAGGVRLRRVKGCTRCIVTTTDQAMGTRDGDEPLRTLRQFRFDRELKGVVFGQNLILIEGLGAQLRVGQELEVIPAPV
jgi:uncharacterized protein